MPLPPPDIPVLEVFYASTCEPCHLELPNLAQLVQDTNLRMVIVLLTDEVKARNELQAVSPDLEAVSMPSSNPDARAALRAAGDADGILPYARLRQADGRLCGSWRGILTAARVKILLASCGKD